MITPYHGGNQDIEKELRRIQAAFSFLKYWGSETLGTVDLMFELMNNDEEKAMRDAYYRLMREYCAQGTEQRYLWNQIVDGPMRKDLFYDKQVLVDAALVELAKDTVTQQDKQILLQHYKLATHVNEKAKTRGETYKLVLAELGKTWTGSLEELIQATDDATNIKIPTRNTTPDQTLGH
jgi:hypothetical protein